MIDPKLSFKHQSGAVLAISLVMLLLLTLIGVTGTQVTGLEEKMAGNSKNQNLAFQSAEAALRGGETQIENIVALSAFTGSNGLLGEANTIPDHKSTATWNSSNSIQYDSGSTFVKTQPRYFIKYINTGKANTGASINIGGYGGGGAGAAVSFFSVTARGTGGQDNSQVILRSYYGKRF